MRIKTLLFLLICTASLHAKGPKTYGSLYVSEVVRVIDGDTIKVNIEHVHPLIGEAISIRLAGVDTPELSSTNKRVKALALKAKAFVNEEILNAQEIRLNNLRRDKYFRILADVIVDGKNLSDLLIEKRLGKPYHGGKKPNWSQ